MEQAALHYLAELVYNYCGLNYVTNQSSLKMKIIRRLRELNMTSIWSYIHYLEANESEWTTLVELLTINETYFYREDKQLIVYQQELLPKFLQESKQQHIHVWSAGCSTGEEPYSIAIQTLSSGLIDKQQVKIDATDINERVLAVAKNGVYGKKSLSFRRIPGEWLNHYFVDQEHEFAIRDEVKDMVSFAHLNLCDTQLQLQKEKYDVIFCRNVLIYFDEPTIKKVVTRFYHALKPGGYLFLGHAETITKYDLGFETMHSNSTFYYRKG